MNNRSSGLAELIATIYFIVFCIPGFIIGGFALVGLGRAGWSVLGLPAWTAGVFAWAAWASICGILILSKGVRLPWGWSIARSRRQSGWARLAPLLLSPCVIVVLGSAESAGGGRVDFPIGAAIREALPVFGWAVFVAVPASIAVSVLFDLWTHLAGPASPGAPRFASESATEVPSRPNRDTPVEILQIEESWEQRFARQRAQRLAAQRSVASDAPGG
ncbi:MAG: hypothetical protein EKK53_23860 [Burkholderiales bacterium]|nr:MAG: hypothetical protein EKK53_23860 [Burkholderiales bacterium]